MRTFLCGLRHELAPSNGLRNARAVCDLHADVDRDRFEAILVSLATGRTDLPSPMVRAGR